MHERKIFTLKRELDFGDILTACSILISVFALALTWRHDQKLKTQAYADDIRKSTAAVTGKLERWSQLSDLYFEDVMPSFVSVSSDVARRPAQEPANGNMYKGLQEAGLRASERISKEELETSYMELYRYVQELQNPFDDTITSIKQREQQSHDDLEDKLQTALGDCIQEAVTRKWLLCTNQNDKPSTPPQIRIGNHLRIITGLQREQAHKAIEQITQTLRAKMLCVIRLPDDQLRDSPVRADAVKKILDAKDINKDGCPK